MKYKYESSSTSSHRHDAPNNTQHQEAERQQHQQDTRKVSTSRKVQNRGGSSSNCNLTRQYKKNFAHHISGD